MLAYEADRFLQTLLKRIPRLPAGYAPQLGHVRKETLNLASGRPNARRVLPDRYADAHESRDLASEIANRYLLPHSYVGDLSHQTGRLQHRNECGRRVLHEREVASRQDVAELELGFPRQDLLDHCRDDGATALARAVSIEWPHDLDRGRKGTAEGYAELVGRDLRRRVRRLADDRMLFIDRHPLGSPVHLAGRGDQHMFEIRYSRPLQDVVRALDIGSNVRQWRLVRVRNADESCQMQDARAALHRVGYGIEVTDIARLHLYAAGQRVALEPAPKIPRVVVNESADSVALLDARLDDVRADESARAGDQQLRHLSADLKCVS